VDKTLNEPNDNEYVHVEFVYMDKVTIQPAKYLKPQKVFIIDFYSGNGYVNFSDAISWTPRIPSGVAGHPWCSISNGIA
jgi:hypothetical protein